MLLIGNFSTKRSSFNWQSNVIVLNWLKPHSINKNLDPPPLNITYISGNLFHHQNGIGLSVIMVMEKSKCRRKKMSFHIMENHSIFWQNTTSTKTACPITKITYFFVPNYFVPDSKVIYWLYESLLVFKVERIVGRKHAMVSHTFLGNESRNQQLFCYRTYS